MTGNPKKKLPDNWENIPGTSGCTLQNCYFRDNYENLIQLNALPIGISTQSIEEIKEMTLRLGIQFDIISDFKQELINEFSLPTFEVEKKVAGPTFEVEGGPSPAATTVGDESFEGDEGNASGFVSDDENDISDDESAVSDVSDVSTTVGEDFNVLTSNVTTKDQSIQKCIKINSL